MLILVLFIVMREFPVACDTLPHFCLEMIISTQLIR